MRPLLVEQPTAVAARRAAVGGGLRGGLRAAGKLLLQRPRRLVGGRDRSRRTQLSSSRVRGRDRSRRTAALLSRLLSMPPARTSRQQMRAVRRRAATPSELNLLPALPLTSALLLVLLRPSSPFPSPLLRGAPPPSLLQREPRSRQCAPQLPSKPTHRRRASPLSPRRDRPPPPHHPQRHSSQRRAARLSARASESS